MIILEHNSYKATMIKLSQNIFNGSSFAIKQDTFIYILDNYLTR